jgi:HlyD family secretion protein/epimerase transport system membrane fusion protein
MTTTQALTVAPGGRALVLSTAATKDPALLRRRIRGPARFGSALVLLFVGGFGAWAALAPMAAGAVAPGILSPDGSKKTVQHLEGGIIHKLLVRDGDVVAAGQPLLELDNVQPRATYESLLHDHRTLLATRLRLEAEKADLDSVEFPGELQGDDDALRVIVNDQRELFQTRSAMHRARKQILRQRIEQLSEQIKGYEAQVESTSHQLAYIAEEVGAKDLLQRQGHLPKPELFRMQRMQAEILGRQGEYVATIARTRQQIGETELQLLALDAERADQIATQLDQTRAKLSEVDQRLQASKDILNRTVVTAPVSGIVLNLRLKTEGGVVQRGEPIMEIVPSEDMLLIDARISPNDIDVVHSGLPAQVHLSAYSNRTTPRVHGTVRSVSADRLVDEGTHQAYYLARVEVDRQELGQLAPRVELIPGMPAEVMIVTGERTLLEYLVQQFLDILQRSFREV